MSSLYARLAKLLKELQNANLTEDEIEAIEDEIEEVEDEIELEESGKYDDDGDSY
jgi:hypothetical protein